MPRWYWWLILSLALMVLVTVGVSTLYKPITKLPPYPTVDVHDFKPTKIDPKGIGIIERAIEHGIDSQAVLAELERIFLEAYDREKDPLYSLNVAIEAERTVRQIAMNELYATMNYFEIEIDKLE